METDDLRALFLNEFDAMADYVAPINDLSPHTEASGVA